jgi:hypothetical protein
MKTCGFEGCTKEIPETDLWCPWHRENRNGVLRHMGDRDGDIITPTAPPLTKEEIAGFEDPDPAMVYDENGRLVSRRTLAMRYRRETIPVAIAE